MTIYSVRDSLGQELWWTTSRAKALDIAGVLTKAGDWIHTDGRYGHDQYGLGGLKAHQLPVAVYKSSVVKARA